MADETLRFDILVGRDTASGGFSRVGGSVRDMGDKMNIATKSALILDDALKRQMTAARVSADATIALAKADDILADAEHVLRDGALETELALKRETEAKKKSGDAALDAAGKNRVLRDSLSGAGSGGNGFSLAGALPGASGIVNPYTIAAGAAAAPFAGQMAAGGIIAGFGTALAGLAILGASKTKSVEASFASLKTHASADLAQIGKPFVPVMDSILSTAKSTMDKLTPVFKGAERVIAGPFKQFGDTLVTSFNQPAVRTSIDAVAVSFAKVTKALTPQLPGMIKSVADGITNIAHSVSANPKAFADFVSFLFKAAGAALNTIAWLTRVASYIEAHFGPAMHRTAVIFDGVRHDIDHTWDQIFENSVGMVIRLGHDVERDFSDFRHRTAVVFDGMRGDIGHYWDMTWNNTVSRSARGVHDVASWFASMRHGNAASFGAMRSDAASIWNTVWNNTVSRTARGVGDVMSWVGTLPGRVSRTFSGAGSWLYGQGRAIVGGLWDGLRNVWSSVSGWFSGLPSQILHALHIQSPPPWAIDAGKHIMGGILKGLAHNAADVPAFFRGLASNILGPLSGVWKTVTGFFGGSGGGSGPVQALARSMAAARGWTGAQWNALNAVEMAEAGWSLTAQNPSSGAYGIAQFINGPSEYAQYGGNSSTAPGQVAGFLNYVGQRYGSPAAAWAHEQAFHWYGAGTMSAAAGWAVVGERGPELMHFRGGEQVVPAGRGGGGTTTIIIKVDPAIAAATPDGQLGRSIAQHLGKYVKGGGRIYPPGTSPR